MQGLSNRNGGAHAHPFAWAHESYRRPASFVLASIIFATASMHFIAWPAVVSDLTAQGEIIVRQQLYASGSHQSKSFGLQPQLLRALAVAVAKPGSKAMLVLMHTVVATVAVVTLLVDPK